MWPFPVAASEPYLQVGHAILSLYKNEERRRIVQSNLQRMNFLK